MVGGVLTSFLAELVVLPAMYFIWRCRDLEKGPLFPRGDASTGRDSEQESERDFERDF